MPSHYNLEIHAMDKELQKGLSDRLYDKRKIAALELEQLIRKCVTEDNRDKIRAIIDELCRNFAYAVHHPNSRNGGLIGLAAATIALGQNEVATYLEDIIHPVLACFGDQDARVRYYACESMYNIAKVAKGEILLYFNEIFDALCKLAADTEPSVKNGADLLDRLIKDIVAEKAATYVSVINKTSPTVLPSSSPKDSEDTSKPRLLRESPQNETTFSLAKFIPVLTERIYVINPFARMFLVSWISLLDSIPDLELVSYLPSFLGGLIAFLSDANKDVRVATNAALNGFLQEIRRVTQIKRTVALEREAREKEKQARALNKALADRERPASLLSNTPSENNATTSTFIAPEPETAGSSAAESAENKEISDDGSRETAIGEINNEPSVHEQEGEEEQEDEGLYIPGQDVFINFDKIIEILISHLDSSEEEIQVTVLLWIETILDVCPYSMLPYGPRFLSVLLPTMACEGNDLRHGAERVNDKMLDLILSLPDNPDNGDEDDEDTDTDRLDYAATVNALTLHFLNEKEQTRVAALDWLIMLHRKVPRRILAINDGTFPALLKTLSDSSEEVITKDLQLLAQISYKSDDEYFAAFMVNLLNLFSTDRRLLDTRGKLIIRQLGISLNPERIYRTLAEILERDDDVEFASLMVLNLNNNLITAPELGELRTRLRSLDTRDGASIFVALFKSWCHNSAAALSLCLLAQAYEHAFLVLQIICEFDITVSLLVQIDKLVQLLESPVFTQLRLQLLEPERYPFLYKCLYGILMLLPQSTAFNTLRNRLNSVSAIGYIHFPQPRSSTVSSGAKSKYQGSREDVKWVELLEKFRSVQRRLQAARNQTYTRSFKPDAGSLGGRERLTSPDSRSNSALLAYKSKGAEKGYSQGGLTTNGSSSSTLTVKNNKDGARKLTSRGTFSLRRGDDKKK
jgi:vacuole morphology and inheritance protein 14